MNQLKGQLALQLLREFVAATGDEEAKGHFNALVLRLQALQAAAERDVTTFIDEHGHVTVGLKTVGMAVETVGMR
jgi:ferritin-like protein